MNYAKARQVLIDNGYHPLPVIQNDKRPACSGWTDPAYVPPQRGFDDCGIGVLCGVGAYPIAALDIDVLDEKLSDELYKRAVELFGPTILRIGRYPKRLLVYRFQQAGVPKMLSKKYRCGRIEVLGAGQYFVAYGVHPDTKKPYKWGTDQGEISEILADFLPTIDPVKMQDFFDEYAILAEDHGYRVIEDQAVSTSPSQPYDPSDPLDRVPPLDITPEKLESALQDIDPDVGRGTWIKVGLALHHQSDGEPWGFDLWDAWSAKGAKYVAGETERYWADMGNDRRRPVTAAYILKTARESRESKVPPTAPTAPQTAPAEGENPFRTLPWSTARFVGRPAPMPMIIDGFLPKGIVAMLYSAGGIGKSTLMLYACAKVALATRYETDFLGYPVNGGRAVIITAEDPEGILHKRLLDAVEALAVELDITVEDCRALIDANLSIVGTQGKCIQLFSLGQDGVLKKTKAYEQLADALDEIEDLQIVVIDTKSRYSPAEGAGNVVATQEVTHYETIAKRTGATVMFLHHDNKVSRGLGLSGSGASSYRDATALYDSVRAAWHLVQLTDADIAAQGITDTDGKSYLLLDTTKNNYLPPIKKQLLTRCGAGYTAQPLAAKPPMQKKEEQLQADLDKLLAVLQSVKTGTCRQAEVLRLCAESGMGRLRTIAALRDARALGLVLKSGEKTTLVEYALTDDGLLHGLTLNRNPGEDFD